MTMVDEATRELQSAHGVSRPWKRGWSLRDAALLVLSIGLTLWTFRYALVDLLRIGVVDPEQQQILLAPFVAFWLFWLRRSRLRVIRVAPSFWGPAIVAAGWGAHALGIRLDAEVLWHGGLVIALVGCIVSFAGLQFVRAFAPAIAALGFLLPVPAFIRVMLSEPMQELAVVVTQSVLELLGTRVTREGFTLVVGGQPVGVDAACNGMRMVLALLLVVYTFAFSIRLRPTAAVLLVVLSPLTAIACNVMRLVPTALVIGLNPSETAAMAFHDAAGWLMLPLALMIQVWLIRLARWMELPVMSFRLAMR